MNDDLIKREHAVRAVAEHMQFEASLEHNYENLGHYKKIAERILQNVPSAGSVDRKKITEHLKHMAYESAMNNLGIQTDAGELFEDIADYRIDLWVQCYDEGRYETQEEMSAAELLLRWEEIKPKLENILPELSEIMHNMAMQLREASAEIALAIREAQDTACQANQEKPKKG